jgi:antitoxin component YwqK of YwqJK toxin-antitoxin module
MMKKFYFIFVFFIGMLQLSAQKDLSAEKVYTTVRTFYEDGTLASEINYVNYKPYGVYQFYYPDGTLMEEGVWNEKHLTGSFKRYYENGQLAQDFQFDEQGNRIGQQKYFYQSGNLQAEKKMGPPTHIIVRYTTDGHQKSYISF